jgi:hypothetical protein
LAGEAVAAKNDRGICAAATAVTSGGMIGKVACTMLSGTKDTAFLVGHTGAEEAHFAEGSNHLARPKVTFATMQLSRQGAYQALRSVPILDVQTTRQFFM